MSTSNKVFSFSFFSCFSTLWCCLLFWSCWFVLRKSSLAFYLETFVSISSSALDNDFSNWIVFLLRKDTYLVLLLSTCSWGISSGCLYICLTTSCWFSLDWDFSFFWREFNFSLNCSSTRTYSFSLSINF